MSKKIKIIHEVEVDMSRGDDSISFLLQRVTHEYFKAINETIEKVMEIAEKMSYPPLIKREEHMPTAYGEVMSTTVTLFSENEVPILAFEVRLDPVSFTITTRPLKLVEGAK